MTSKITKEVEKHVYQRDRWTCAYCGFDGRSFDSWMQLTLDHVMPQHIKADHSEKNLVACCTSCNSITSRMKFDAHQNHDEILALKLERVRERREWYLERWKEYVLPHILDQAQSPNRYKIGKLVRDTFQTLFNEQKLADSEIENLCDAAYSKQTFGLNYPVLKRSSNLEDRFDENGHARYYSKIHQGNFLLCSQWYEGSRSQFEKWLVGITKKEVA